MNSDGIGFRPLTIEPLHHVKRSMTMTSKVEQRLQEIGVSIPDAPTPAANYLPFTRTGNLVFVSGQVPFVDGKLSVTGTVGKDASIEDAQSQAKVCAINLLAQLKMACDGDLDRVVGLSSTVFRWLYGKRDVSRPCPRSRRSMGHCMRWTPPSPPR